MNAKVLGILLLLIILCVMMSLLAPESFLTGNNIENLLRRTALYGILGVGVAFVIITSGIDLSIGSVVCLAGCCLAVFLRVDYEPFDLQQVLAVRGSEKSIVLRGGVQSFSKGDVVRYYGGRRAKNAVLVVTHLEPTQFSDDEDGEIIATNVLFDKPLSANDRYGRLAKVYDVKAFEAGDRNAEPPRNGEITVSSDLPEVKPKDQVILFHETDGEKLLTVVGVKSQGDDVLLTLSDGLGSQFNDQWRMIPIERRQRMSIPAAIGLVLLIGLALGLVHGLLITKLELPSFVVTLCGLLIYRGVSRYITNDQAQGFSEYGDSLSPLATGKLTVTSGGFGIPYPFFIFLFMVVVAAIFLNKTIWGRYMQALGFSKDAAEYSGINTDRITVFAYVICTVLAVIGGMLFALDGGSVSPGSFGNFFELYAIAAAVLGGCSLRGGEGSILGVVIGTAVMRMLYNLIVLLKISDRLEFAIIGMVILAGVIADVILQRAMAQRRAAAQARTTEQSGE